MKERPILFSGVMVRAILEGRKTQTRRVVKPEPKMVRFGISTRKWAFGEKLCRGGMRNVSIDVFNKGGNGGLVACPYGWAGDRLWVRETFHQGSNGAVLYAADCEANPFDADVCGDDHSMVGEKWRPSIFMPRKLSRLTLEIVSVRVDRVREISMSDVVAEGCMLSTSKAEPLDFQNLWDSINAKRGFGWSVNPWVWVVEFKRLEGKP